MMSPRTIAALLLALSVAACGDDPSGPIPGGGDPENISLVRVVLTPTGGGTSIQSTRVDPDGTQLPLPPGIPAGVLELRQGTTYAGQIVILNDLDPQNVVDVTGEIEEEANFHRLFYTVSCGGVTMPIGSMNVDTQSPAAPLGTTFQVVVAADAPVSSGCTFTVELRHFETNKGDGAGSNFETDIALEFPATVAP